MRHMLVKVLVTLVVAGAYALAGGVSSAKADNAPPSNGSLPVVNIQSSEFAVTQKDTAILQVSANGKIQVAYTMPLGLPKAQKQQATSCLIAGNDTRTARRGEKCGRIKIGTSITNSGTCRSTGRWCMFGDHVKAGDTFYLNGGQWRKGKCGNKVWFKFSPKPRPKGPVLPAFRVQVVQYFTYTARVHVVATATSKAAAQATCVTSVGNWAMAYGEGSGSAKAEATGFFTARVKVNAIAGATASAMRMIESQKVSVSGSASAQASSSASARAVASCSGQAPQPPPPPPPPTPTPSYSCSVSSVTEKDGRLVRLNLSTNGSPTRTDVNWGDGSTSTNTLSHTYNSDGTFNVNVSLTFSNGSASCGTQAVTKAASPPPPPPAAPGPNPPSTSGGAGGTTAPGGGTIGGGPSPCPPGWKPDGTGTGCVPA